MSKAQDNYNKRMKERLKKTKKSVGIALSKQPKDISDFNNVMFEGCGYRPKRR